MVSLPNNLLAAASLLVVMLVAGPAGYMIIEGWGFLDSLYMTFITVTNVRFREVNKLDDAGQVFTIVLATGGVGTIFYETACSIPVHPEGGTGHFIGGFNA